MGDASTSGGAALPPDTMLRLAKELRQLRKAPPPGIAVRSPRPRASPPGGGGRAQPETGRDPLS